MKNNIQKPQDNFQQHSAGRTIADKGSAPDLSVVIAGVKFKNPIIAASGTFGFGKEYAELFDLSCLGGICTKGLTLEPRPGNSGERLWETPAGLLNSIGLENPGIKEFLKNELPRMRKIKTVIIANLSGSTIEEYAEGAALLNNSDIDMIELNISCPNVKAGGIAFGLDPAAACSVTEPVRRACPDKPLIVKLSPNAADITAIAKACINSGADAISLVNTIKAMAIDIKKKKLVFDNISAGLSGPAIKPIALRMVWELNTALAEQTPAIPIIGMGGISNTEDALEFLMAGAKAIQIGSATFANPFVMPEIIDGIKLYMQKNKLAGIGEITL